MAPTSPQGNLNPDHQVLINAPSRLHFGLFSLGHKDQRKYGGVGVMLAKPGLKLTITAESHLRTQIGVFGPMAERALEFAERWFAFQTTQLGRLRLSKGEFRNLFDRLRLEVLAAPPDHVGLGVGTQLGLSVAAGLNYLFDLPAAEALELALSVGRASRSAVGTYGFLTGGLIVERGRTESEPISPLDCRIDFPADWRFLLVRPTAGRGMHGSEETSAMQALPAVPLETTQALIAEACETLIPAAATANFGAFSRSVYRYGHLAGNCYSTRQGGPYNGPVLTCLVETLRSLGIEGVGQSSWGPTLFAVCESQATADEATQLLLSVWKGETLQVQITAAANQGASVTLCQ